VPIDDAKPLPPVPGEIEPSMSGLAGRAFPAATRSAGPRHRSAILAAAMIVLPAAFALGLAEPVASYRIACRYDDARHRIEGTELLTWKNTGSRPATSLRFHLYLNAFANNRSSYMLENRRRGKDRAVGRGEWGGITVSRLTAASGEDLLPGLRFIAPDDGNAEDRTVAEVALPAPIAPGETARFSVEFVTELPRVIDRSGWAGEFALVAQWFPKIGVFSAGGWNCHQYHADSEFFADFGDYDVTIDVPRRLKGRLGGTGLLLEEREAPGDRVLEHFRAESVHDFAWTADPSFLVSTEPFHEAGLPETSITLLCPPEHRGLRARYFAAAKASLSAFGKWYGPYPYAALTIVDPPPNAREAWGMEYPTFIAGGASAFFPAGAWQAPESLEATVAHEIAHQYFYGLLASNEFEEAWLDEGFARYSEVRLMAELKGDAHPVIPVFGFPVELRSVALHPPLDTQFRTFSSISRDPLTASWKFETSESYGLVYGKMALVLASLERTVGRAVMDRVLLAYATEFRFRHPTTADFVGVVERITGRPWRGYFARALFSAGVVDYAVARADSKRAAPPAGRVEVAGRTSEVEPSPETRGGPYETNVVIERRGDVPLPVEIRLQFEGKKTYTTTWDGEARWIRLHVDAGPKLVRADVDPDGRILLDADRNNNGWIVRSDAAAANLWTARSFFWAENLLDLFMELW